MLLFDRATDLQRAFHWRFRARVKDQRHAIAGRDFYQLSGGFRLAELLCATNDLIERLQQRPLILNRNLRVTDDIDEEDMCQLQLNFFLYLSRHFARRAAISFPAQASPRVFGSADLFGVDRTSDRAEATRE